MDVSDPKDIALSAKRAKSRESAKKVILRQIMENPSGRLWMYDALSECGVFRNPFSTDALATAFACGVMNVGQKLLADVNRYCPELYQVMIEEENGRRSNSNPVDDD